jgi:3-phenylpropionate/trans-cinnamate dioxygenase ferredoxin subunit
MPFRRIAFVADIPPGTTRFFPHDSGSVVIANWSGEFFAVDGLCPHKGFELDRAQLWDCRIECPWHHYEYDIRTGENCFPRSAWRGDLAQPVQPIATYRVELRGPEIWVEIE